MGFDSYIARAGRFITDARCDLSHKMTWSPGTLRPLLDPATAIGGAGPRKWCEVEGGQTFCGNPRLIPPWLGSSHREVTTLPRVKKLTPSTPWAWASPNREDFQPPNE